MSVWMVCPSARPAADVNARVAKWQVQGYGVALWRDSTNIPSAVADTTLLGSYPGYPSTMNRLIEHAFAIDPTCDWVVCGADDIDPDPRKTADEIAAECTEYFAGRSGGENVDHNTVSMSLNQFYNSRTFGVMQPTGDRWGADELWARLKYPNAPAYIDRICGSPWIGREFARRINQGKGVWRTEYRHMFCDEELQEVAKKYGVLWQRPDLIHFHDHWGRTGDARKMPAFLRTVNTPTHWEESKAIFTARKATGFPGSEPID